MEPSKFDDVVVVIPAFNEGTKITETIKEVKNIFKNLVVVDDGSTDNTISLIRELDVIAVRHPINLGQGAALQTGITKALSNSKFNYILTFDADGQHSVDSAVQMVEEIKFHNVDVVLGSRFLKDRAIDMPSKKKVVLRLGIAFTRIDSGLKITDTHNGLRVMNRKFASTLQIQHAGMAHASEILNHIKETGASWREYPAQIFYTEYSMRKGQSVLNAINILTEMIYK
jgi:glycosyltransferase involved in cell wall biosynthesis